MKALPRETTGTWAYMITAAIVVCNAESAIAGRGSGVLSMQNAVIAFVVADICCYYDVGFARGGASCKGSLSFARLRSG